jgi:hypothetical protein
MMLYALPAWMLPEGYDRRAHDKAMLLMSGPEGNTIRGEAGDQMGRGGRSTVYIIDEGAFIERAERVEASTSANSDVRIWGSSANGPGNLFHQKRFDGSMRPDQVFRLHWTDDPRKTKEWAAAKEASMLPHIWASEYEIDYSASVEGICIPAPWVASAKRIAKLMAERNTPIEPTVTGIGGLDVGGGKAKSVFVARFGPVVATPVSRGDPDTTETALWGLDQAQACIVKRSDGTECKVRTLNFDNVGIGLGVSSTLSKAGRKGLSTIGVNVGVPASDTKWPDGETSEEKFGNLKAEVWMTAAERFKATHEMVLFIEGKPGGIEHPPSELISIPDESAGPDAAALAAQLSLPKKGRNEKGKITIESKDHLAKRGIASPDHAEGLILTFVEGKDVVAMWSKLAG